MAIVAPAEPEGYRSFVHDALARLRTRAQHLPALNGSPQTGAPLRHYVLSAVAASHPDPLSAATHVGWQYPVVGGAAPGFASVYEEPGGLKFSGLSHGALPERLMEAAVLAEDTLKSQLEEFEPRLLQSPALRISALWLCGKGGANFFIVLDNTQQSGAWPLQIERNIQARIDAALADLRARASAAAIAEREQKQLAHERRRVRNAGLAALLLATVGVLVAFAATGQWYGYLNPYASVGAWAIDLFIVAGFFCALGIGFKGWWFGILVDGRNKISMSRLQITLWTILFVATFLVIYIWNVAHATDIATAIGFTVPATVWLLMGMSGVSAAGTPAILSLKSDAAPASPAPTTPKDTSKFIDGTVVKRKEGEAPRWSDILLGDEAGNYDSIDIGKVQLLLLTLVAIVTYAYVIVEKLLAAKGIPIDKLPDMSSGFLTLLGASHVTYLGYKAVSHSN
jgi:hypothetical protein